MKTVAMVKDKTQYYTIFQPVLEEFGFQVKLYDVWQENQLDAMLYDSFDAFIWRAKHNPSIRKLARRYIYFFNQEMQLPTYPDWHSYWHYDDKIAQSMLFQKYDIPSPKTRVFVCKDKALHFAEDAEYPLIFKCAHGAGSSNVGMLKNKKATVAYIKKAFDRGLKTNFKDDRQKGYVYFQEFLPNNDGDYRLVCYDDVMAHGFFRNNRAGEPFASGSGKFQIFDLPESLLDFTTSVNKKLKNSIMSYDLIKGRNDEWVITEMSVIYGDLTNQIYNKTPVFQKQANSWTKMTDPENHINMTIKYILERVWKWR